MKTTINPFSLKENHTATVFDTPGQFMEWLDQHADTHSKSFGGGFYSNEDWQSVKAKAVAGDKDVSARADKLMNRLTAHTPDTVKRVRKRSPHGRASVGAYLASDPMPCRTFVKKPANTAPLSMVVSLNSMADVTAKQLEERGVVIAALVKRLTKTRPVNLHLSRFSQCGDNRAAMLVKFPTAPLDSYRLAWLLSSQGFCRGAGFAFHETAPLLTGQDRSHGIISFAGGTGYSQSRHCQYQRDLASFLGTDVFYLPGSDQSNADFAQMVSDPVAWLNETCDELTRA